MKTSNLLLLILLSFLFTAMIGVDFAIKNTFEQIDRNDPYHGYSSDTLSPFKYVKLSGNNFTLTQIQPGEQFEMRSMNFEKSKLGLAVKWEVRHDTLYVSYNQSKDYDPYYKEEDLNEKPGIYIMAPKLSGVNSAEIVCRISGWLDVDFSVVQSGRWMHLSDNSFSNLDVTTMKHGYVSVLSNNHLGNTTVQVSDNSTFRAYKNVFKSIQLQADSTAIVSLPGNLWQKNLNL